MIVPMNRLTVIFPSEEREELLKKLQKMGAVQLETQTEQEVTVRQTAMALSERYLQAQKLLKNAYRTRNRQGLITCAEPVEPLSNNPMERLKQTERALEECDSSHAHLAAQEKELADWSPWGEYDPVRLRQLIDRGISIRLVKMAHRLVHRITPQIEEAGGAWIEAGNTTTRSYLILLDYAEELPQGVEEFDLSTESYGDRQQKLREAERRAELARRQIAALYADMAPLQRGWEEATDAGQLQIASSQLGTELDGRMVTAAGWFPESRRSEVEKLLQTMPLWYEIRQPLDDEEPPVQLHNKGFSRLFEPIATLHSLPQYRELDPVPYFSFFFAFFVGCCLGDAAYGALILILALLARRIAPPSIKPILSLLAVLGGSTIFCGIMFNSFFGVSLPLPEWLSPLAADLTTSEFPMMSLALLIGFVQILFAIGLRAYSCFKFSGWKDAVEPISYIAMTVGVLIWASNTSMAQGELLGLKIHNFNVNGLAVGRGLATIPSELGTGLMIAGALGIIIFSNAGAPPVMRHSFLALWTIYNYITKIVSDSLSYLRLFALGLAGGLLGASFNTIALMLVTDSDGTRNLLTPLLIGTLLILVIGHTLNLLLAFIGGVVHPLRLTFVEFYSNMGYQGGGKPYLPLKKVSNRN